MTKRDDCKTCFCDAKRQHRAFVQISDDYANRFQKEQEEYIDGKRRRTQPHKCLLTVSEVPKPDVEYSCRPDSVCGQAAVAPRTNTKIKPFMILKPILAVCILVLTMILEPILAVCILVLTMVLIYPPALPSVYPYHTEISIQHCRCIKVKPGRDTQTGHRLRCMLLSRNSPIGV